MTINKYLQDKVDINEITESDRDFILRQIDQIENKEVSLFSEKEKYCIYRILSIYYIDYLNNNNNKTVWRTATNIYNDIDGFDNNDTIEDINKVLELLVSKNILKVEKRNEENTQFYFENYTFSDAVINSLKAIVSNDNENIKDSKSKKFFIEPRVEAKKFLEAHFEAYQKYDEIVLNDIGMILTECFNFEANSVSGMINFKMNGAKAGSEPCNYNVYLSRGYICLEEEDNTCADNIWHADGIEMLIDLIKDVREDN